MEQRMSAFDDFIDEVYGEVEIMGIRIPASKVLKECDPIAYTIAQHDYEETANETEWDNA
jgi:hypothetical protein